MHITKREDFDDRELAEIEAEAARRYPGKTVKFAGDMPFDQLPPDVQRAVAELERLNNESLVLGTCFDCHAQMPDYPAEADDFPSDWRPASGWNWVEDRNKNPMHWLCPECAQKDDRMQEIMIEIDVPGM
jgi:hypothetical protein